MLYIKCFGIATAWRDIEYYLLLVRDGHPCHFYFQLSEFALCTVFLSIYNSYFCFPFYCLSSYIKKGRFPFSSRELGDLWGNRPRRGR